MGEGFFELLRESFEPALDRTFLRLPGGGAVTYREMDARSELAAGWLAHRGASAGDRVVSQIPKSVDAVALYLGVLRLGAVYVPLNTAHTRAELDWFVADAEPAAVVRDAGELAAGLGDARPLRGVARRGAHDLAAIVYTSGTTGRPKGAMLTHSNLASNALTLREAWGFTPGDVLLHALPIFHVHGLMVALHTAMLSACEVVFLERFSAQEVVQHLPGATAVMGVPTHYSRLLAHPGFHRHACGRIRLLVSGSAPMPAALHRAVAERTGLAVLERYGMSETLMIASNPLDGDRVAGTVGFALPGVEVRVRADDGEAAARRPRPRPAATPKVRVRADDGEAAAGRAGMVQVRGPSVGPGYWRRPDATADSRTGDGWFATGDIGRLGRDGRLTLEGRATDMVVSGGVNVYPAEIEEALNGHRWVAESAVVGLAHPDLGEAVAAFVVASGAAPADGRTLAAELAGALAGLARFKHPKRYEFVKELPRNAMGKVLKAELRARHADLFTGLATL